MAVVLPQDTRSAVPRTILAVLAALPLAENVPDPEGALQTTPVALERSLTILPFPRRAVPVTSVLDCYRRSVAVIAALPPAESFPNPGGKVAANAALPQDTFPVTDEATMVALSPAKMISDQKGRCRRRLRTGDLG